MVDYATHALQALPSHYSRLTPNFADFVSSYYTWLQQIAPRDANLRDVMVAEEEFVRYFKEEFAIEIQTNNIDDDRVLVRNIVDLYRAKGSPRAIDLYFRIVHGVGASVSYPREVTLQPSAGEWMQGGYVCCTRVNPTDIKGKKIRFSSGVESVCVDVKRQQTDSGTVDLLYLDGYNNQISVGDAISIGGASIATVLPSLTGVDISISSHGMVVGQQVEIESETGSGADGVIAEVYESANTVEYQVSGIGSGYTLFPEIITSDLLLTVTDVTDPEVPEFPYGTTLSQSVYIASLPSQSNTFTNGQSITLTTLNISNVATSIVNGTIVGIEQDVDSGDTLVISSTAPQANVLSTNYVSTATANSFGTTLTLSNVTSTVVGVADTVILEHSTPAIPLRYGMSLYQYDGSTKIAEGIVRNRVTPTSFQCEVVEGHFQSATPARSVDSQSGTVAASITGVTWKVGVRNVTGTFRSGVDVTCGDTVGELASIAVSEGNAPVVDNLTNSCWYLTTSTLDPTYDAFVNVPQLTAVRSVRVGFVTDLKSGFYPNNSTIVSVRQPMTSSAGSDRVTVTVADGSKFAVGESVVSRGTVTQNRLITLASVGNSVPGEIIYQGTIGSPTAYGVVESVNKQTNTLTVSQITGTFATSTNATGTSGLGTSNTTAVVADTNGVIAYGLIESINGNNITVIRSPRGTFATSTNLHGLATGAVSNITAVSAPAGGGIGTDLRVKYQVQDVPGKIKRINIKSSGIGFAPQQRVTVKIGGVVVAEGTAAVSGVSLSPGTQRYASPPMYLHDGYYYQDFSYEVVSSISYDKYQQALNGPLQITGTALFGKVQMESTAANNPTISTELAEVDV